MKRAGTLSAIALLAILVTAALACNGGAETVRMGTEGAYPPYNFINDSGEIVGFERELGDELCRRANLECTWMTNEWDSMIPNLIAGNYDTILAGMSITEERDAQIDFTQPYYPPAASVYIALAGAGDAALSGKVAVQESTIHADYLSGRATLLEFALAEAPIAAVLSGEADAALADKAFLNDFVAESGGKLIFVGPELKLDSGVGIGIRESDGELKDKFNQAISAMKADGSLNALIKKWFGEDAETF